jgi:hypothetical protein
MGYRQTDNRKNPIMSDNDKKQLRLVQKYRTLVYIYEALDEKIDSLIMENGGVTEKMSEFDLQQYRSWAQERSEVLNEMRILEQQLNMDTDDDD